MAVVEIHHLRAQVQMTAHVKDTTRVGEHLIEGQAQFIQVEAGGVTQGVKQAGIHPDILHVMSIARPAAARCVASAVASYRPCHPRQQFLLPPALQECLPEGHLAYFISDTVDQFKLDAFHARYAGGGPRNQPFHPVMMV